MEKKRRARINKSLESLLNLLVVSGMCPAPTRANKYDKADILEMTLAYFRNHLARGTVQAFKLGFQQCLTEMTSVLKDSGVDDAFIEDLTMTMQNRFNECSETEFKMWEPGRIMYTMDVRSNNKENQPDRRPQEQIQQNGVDSSSAMWRPWKPD